MKKTVKRLVALMLVLVLAFSLAACTDKKDDKESSKAAGSSAATQSYTKPTSVKVMWDGTILKEADEDTDALYKAYDEAYGLKIEWIRPDHSNYANVITQTFAGSADLPDAFLLSADKYAMFAARGLLYDMSKDWEASGIYDDGRFGQWAKDIIQTYYVEGRNGEIGLFGLPTTRGNGCVTYVRESFLTACGLKADDIKTYDDYYKMLVAMKDKCKLDYVVTGAGYISNEAPYTNYLPEFYQDAYPDFVEVDGKWVDGFQQENMKEALLRLREAKLAGLLDPTLNSNSTGDARNHFYAGDCGVFTYWAGTWMNTIASSLAKNFPEYADTDGDGLKYGDVVALKPIKEVGKYIERMAPCVAIYKNCSDPASVYKYFVEPIYDGDQVMSVWMYGAKGTQWDNVAETVVLNAGTEKESKKTFAEGEFHFKATKKGDKFLAKNNIDPLLALCDYKEGKNPAGSPANAATPLGYEAQLMFNDNSTPAPAIVSNTTIAASLGDINAKRKEVAALIINGEMTYEDAMKEYTKAVGQKVSLCLDSLNE